MQNTNTTQGFLGVMGEETWNYQSKCQSKFKSPNMSHVLKDISQRQSRSCLYSHCVSPIIPAKRCWFSGLQITESTNQTPNKLSMYLSLFHPQDCILLSRNDKCVYNTVSHVHPLLKLKSMLHSCMWKRLTCAYTQKMYAGQRSYINFHNP